MVLKDPAFGGHQEAIEAMAVNQAILVGSRGFSQQTCRRRMWTRESGQVGEAGPLGFAQWLLLQRKWSI